MVGNQTEVLDLLDTEGVAGLYKCSTRTVQRIVAKGFLPFVKLPGSRLLRFRASAVAEAFAKCETFRSIRAPFDPFDDGPGKVAA